MFEGACDMSLFITFEGGEGSGKTTIAKMLHKQLLKKDIISLLVENLVGRYRRQIRDVITDVNKYEDGRKN